MRISKQVERWFEVPNDEDGARIKIRHLSPGEKADIYDQVFVQQINYEKDAKGSMNPKFSQETDKRLDRELTIKKSVVGRGNAAKSQVQHMVKAILGLHKSPQADAADALAIALCHGHSRDLKKLLPQLRTSSRRNKRWKSL